MQYKERQELTIVELNNDKETVSFDELTEIILKKPSNMIYFERNGRLYGIVSMGDISRAYEEGADRVVVNTRFTCIFYDEHMKARKFFYDKTGINALPVVSEDRSLLGAYSRWDDLLMNQYILRELRTTVPIDCHSYIAFVRPRDVFAEKQKIFQECCKYLELQGVTVEVVESEWGKVWDYVDRVEWILFVDEDELRAADTLWLLREDFRKRKLVTWRQYLEYENMAAHLKRIQKQDVYIFSLCFQNGEDYSRLKKDISARYDALGAKICHQVLPAMYTDFFADLYTEEYAQAISHLCFSVESKSGCGKLKDICSRFYNVTNGERCTVGQPKKYQQTIYFVGPCFVYGHYVEDAHTIESFLQCHINEGQYDVKVVNCGSPSSASNALCLDLVRARLSDLPLRRGDIVIIFAKNKYFQGTTEINLADTLKTHDVNVGWMTDGPLHCNHKLNALYAEDIYDKLKPVFAEMSAREQEKIGGRTDFIKEIYIDRYFKNFDPSKYEKIGAIVMNCNPFTNGHRYLIEQALQKTDFLIIFVVEEDKSVFSFAERYAMVCDGVADLDNVMAVPSGPFILTRTSFPEYFIKAADEDLIENTENDITIFAERIAPPLHIKYRFVGEEPEDTVTDAYNTAMKKILPKNGMELVEIPRKEQDGKYISASSVRRCLEENDMEGFNRLVPESTRRILFGGRENCK